jgi:hypothetical protein
MQRTGGEYGNNITISEVTETASEVSETFVEVNHALNARNTAREQRLRLGLSECVHQEQTSASDVDVPVDLNPPGLSVNDTAFTYSVDPDHARVERTSRTWFYQIRSVLEEDPNSVKIMMTVMYAHPPQLPTLSDNPRSAVRGCDWIPRLLAQRSQHMCGRTAYYSHVPALTVLAMYNSAKLSLC